MSQPTVTTSRLMLKMIDPDNTSECHQLMSLYDNHLSGAKANDRDERWIRRKHEVMGPNAQFCTLAPPPKGIYFLIYLLPPTDGQERMKRDDPIGHLTMNFRPEMPCPDLGYALLPAFQGQGIATEACRGSLKFWQETIGVKEVFIGTDEENVKSQKVAERLGFVKAGGFDVATGLPPDEKIERCMSFVLPGMTWPEGLVMRPEFTV